MYSIPSHVVVNLPVHHSERRPRPCVQLLIFQRDGLMKPIFEPLSPPPFRCQIKSRLRLRL